jgi:branched-chain amino acid transport system permease protein
MFLSGPLLLNAAVDGLLLGGLYAVTALGLSFILGVMRLVNLWHGELVILAAYLAWLAFTRWSFDPLLSIVAIAPLLFLLGWAVQSAFLTPLARRGEEAPLLTTFGLSVIAQNVFLLLFTADTRTIAASYANAALSVGSLTIPLVYVLTFAIGLLVCAAAYVLVERTPLGRDIRASTEDPVAAAMSGVDVRRVYALTYGLGAAAAGIGGVLGGIAFPFTPTSGLTYLLNGFSVVVLGGLGSVPGTLIGGLLIGLIESLGGAVFGDGYRDFIGLLVFLVVLALRPQGLLGRAETSLKWRA